MSTALEPRPGVSAELQEKVLLGGDLKNLSTQERLNYYNNICLSLDLNPLTRPFEYLNLSGKVVLYARKDCTEQLRTKRHVSVSIVSREVIEGIYVVTARAEIADPNLPMGVRLDESIGAVPIDKLQGEMRANAMMKGETKAKRRVTLSICGLGMLDETEVESIPGAKVVEPEGKTSEQKFTAITFPSNTRLQGAGIIQPQPEPKGSVLEPPVEEILSEMGEPPQEDIFTQSSARAEHQTVLSECKKADEYQKAWDDVTHDTRLTTEAKSDLYKQYQRGMERLKVKAK